MAKAVIVLVVAYALSPIDLIPDFIPVLGYLDDLLLLPLGILLAMRLIPKEVIKDYQDKYVDDWGKAARIGWIAAAVILVLWMAAIVALWRWYAHSQT